MKHLVKILGESLLDKKLSLFHRGLLISIVILSDPDKAIHLAKVKAKVKFTKDVKQALIDLVDMKFIEWSGFKAAKKSMIEKAEDANVVAAIDFMNNLYKRKFNHHTEGTIKNLRNRLIEHDLDTILLVISNRYAVWKDDEFMQRYLEPTTIFRASKFPKYLEEAQRTKVGSSFVNASKINLKDGDLITFEKSKQLINNDSYLIVEVKLDPSGSMSSFAPIKKVGREIKRNLKMQDNRVNFGSDIDFEYYYKEE